MDTQKIEKLYELLERAEKEHDVEAAAALRWAIFSLENYPQTQHLKEDAMDYEWYDDICCATCIHGSVVKDNDEGYMIYCQEKDEYMPDDGVCGDHEY